MKNEDEDQWKDRGMRRERELLWVRIYEEEMVWKETIGNMEIICKCTMNIWIESSSLRQLIDFSHKYRRLSDVLAPLTDIQLNSNNIPYRCHLYSYIFSFESLHTFYSIGSTIESKGICSVPRVIWTGKSYGIDPRKSKLSSESE